MTLDDLEIAIMRQFVLCKVFGANYWKLVKKSVITSSMNEAQKLPEL